MYGCDDEDYDCTETPVRQFRPMDAAVMAARLPRMLFETIADWLQDLCELLAGHANWKLRQDSPVRVTL